MSDPSAHLARGGKAIYGARLGILMLEARFPRIAGDMGNATTWPFPVLYKVVDGATPRRVVNERASGLLDRFIDGARELVRSGAEGITTNCGYLALYQREIAAAAGVPCATSSLLQIPLVQSTLPPGKRVGVLTINKASLSPDHLHAIGVDADIPIVGTEGRREFHRVIIENELTMDVAQAEADILDAGRELMSQHADIGAVVLECTNMPPYAARLRDEIGVPVYDIYSFMMWFHAGLQPRRFNRSDNHGPTWPPR